MVIEAVCIMKGIKPKRVAGEKLGSKVDDYWEPGRGLLQDPGKFLDSLFKYDKVSGGRGRLTRDQVLILTEILLTEMKLKAPSGQHTSSAQRMRTYLAWKSSCQLAALHCLGQWDPDAQIFPFCPSAPSMWRSWMEVVWEGIYPIPQPCLPGLNTQQFDSSCSSAMP